MIKLVKLSNFLTACFSMFVSCHRQTIYPFKARCMKNLFRTNKFAFRPPVAGMRGFPEETEQLIFHLALFPDF